jgi:signal transduction histidine kinase
MKEAEQKLQKLYRELEIKVAQRTMELLASKHLADIGTLAATVAHELRNPLGVINVAAYNLRKKARDPGLIKHISSIEKKVAEGSQIINNLLVYSRMKMPQFGKNDIYSLLSECAEAVKKHFGGRKIRLKKLLQPLKGMNVDADALQLREIFTNLITNAYQAIEDNRGVVEVSGSVKSGNGIAISIKDTGTGINKEDMANIFKPFFTRKTKGTGLGLVICRDLINMHNGAIEVKSAPGKGSTFTVTIPIRRDK